MSSIRRSIHGWLPPGALVLARKARGEDRRYSNYEEAMAQCGSGYDDLAIASVVVSKTVAQRERIARGDEVLDLGSLRPLIGLAMVGSTRPTRVLDFGGAAGSHYFLARALAAEGNAYDWRVVETTAMAKCAQQMANDELSFFTSIGEAVASWDSPPDLVLASGVLMYLPKPAETLRELIEVGAECMWITRTGLSSDSTRIIVQRSSLAANGPGPLPQGFHDHPIRYPATFIPMTAFESLITNRYRILARVQESTGSWIAGGVSIGQYGFVCRAL